MWYYKRSEPQLWTVGYDDAQGRWNPDSDHDNREDAARRAAFLNGDCTAELDQLRATIAELTANYAELSAMYQELEDRTVGYETERDEWRKRATDGLAAFLDEQAQQFSEIIRLRTENERLINAGLESAYGEAIKTDEANDYYAESERLRAERDDLAAKLAAAQAELIEWRKAG